MAELDEDFHMEIGEDDSIQSHLAVAQGEDEIFGVFLIQSSDGDILSRSMLGVGENVIEAWLHAQESLLTMAETCAEQASEGTIDKGETIH